MNPLLWYFPGIVVGELVSALWAMWLPQCTRCGGAHPVSQCRWPVVGSLRGQHAADD